MLFTGSGTVGGWQTKEMVFGFADCGNMVSYDIFYY